MAEKSKTRRDIYFNIINKGIAFILVFIWRMQVYNNQKPEYVLKRANDIINSATGKLQALLFEFIIKSNISPYNVCYEV